MAASSASSCCSPDSNRICRRCAPGRPLLASGLAILGLSALIDGGLLLQLMVFGEKPPAGV